MKHPEEHKKGDMPKEGYRPCVGWLVSVLGVLGWRTSREIIMPGKGMCITGKLAHICLFNGNRTDML